ncbi:hypothetical protein QZH41_008667 [Actinostola sp. cb2023]|nr:hypothetical protein QZH41_008667 [Actinostola sp. cb2023]
MPSEESEIYVEKHILLFLVSDFGGFNDISLLYVMKEPLHFSSSYIGYFLAEVMFMRGLGVIVGMPLMTQVFKLTDFIIAVIGLAIACVMFVFFGFSTHKWMMFFGAIFALGGGLPVPCMRSIMSKCVESNEQGTMFAAVASLEVLFTLLASLIFNTLYSKTVSWLPGFAFFLMAGILLIPVIILL